MNNLLRGTLLWVSRGQGVLTLTKNKGLKSQSTTIQKRSKISGFLLQSHFCSNIFFFLFGQITFNNEPDVSRISKQDPN